MIEVLETRKLLAFDPSAMEQEMLEHVNRTRLDPQAELNVLFTSMNPLTARDPDANAAINYFNDPTAQEIQTEWPALTAVAPLAWNEKLCIAATGHSQLLVTNDSQSHQEPGEPDLGGRITNAGYTWSAAGENVYSYASSVFNAHSAFAIDWANGGRGHRSNLMDAGFRDFGVGLVADTSPATQVGPLVVTQDFANALNYGNSFLLGVVYRDVNSNQRYDAGEGTGGLTVSVTNGINTYTTTTMSAGGYQLRVPAGTYQVTVTGAGYNGPSAATVRVGAANIKQDFVAPYTGPMVTISSDRSSLKAGDTAALTFTLDRSSSNFTAGDVSVTGGTLSGFAGSGTSYTAVFTPAPNYTGTATVAVAAGTFTDGAGMSNLAGSRQLSVDTVAPTLAITRAGTGTLKVGNTDTITFTLSEASANFVVGDVTTTGGTLSNFVGSGTTYTATFTPTADLRGTATISVAVGAFTDAVGNTSVAGDSISISIDTVSPTLTITRAGTGTLKIGDTDTITFTLSEAFTNFVGGGVSVIGGTLSNFAGSGTVYTATFTPAPAFAGTATVSVMAGTFTNASGNPNKGATLGIAVDAVPPTVTITRSGSGTLKIGDTTRITFAISETSTDFTAGDVAVTGGTLSSFAGSGTSYTATFTPTAAFTGTATVSVAAGAFTDPVGNTNAIAGSLSIAVDTVAPTLAIARAGTGTLKVGDTDTITFTLSEASTNFVVGDVSVSGGTLSNFAGAGTTYAATFTPTADLRGTATISVAVGAFTDTAGNTSVAGASISIPFDTVSPTLTITKAGTGTLKIGGTATITFTLSETSADFAAGDVSVAGGTLSNFTGSGTVYTATFMPAPAFAGTAKVSVAAGTFTNANGNPNKVASLGIAVDTVPPTVTIARAGTGTLKIGDAPTITFTLSETSINFTAGDVSVAGGTLSNFTGSGTVYTATFTPNAAFTGSARLSVAAGAFADPAGNTNATTGSLSIAVDTVAPTLAIARVGTGTLKIGSSDTITFTLSEASTNFVVGSVSVTGGTLSNFTRVSGRIYTATFTPAAAFTGNATVSVAVGAFTDPAGNANASGRSLSIPVDTLAPTVAGFTALPTRATLGIRNSITIVAEFSESLTGTGPMAIQLNSGATIQLVVDGGGLTARGTYTVQPGEVVGDLDVVAVVSRGSLMDTVGNPLVLTVPASGNNLAARCDIVVDGAVKLSDPGGGFSVTPTLVRDLGAVQRIAVSFTTPVTGVTVGSFRLWLNNADWPLQAARVEGSGQAYTLVLPISRIRPLGIYRLEIAPGAAIRATADRALVSTTTALYWGNGQSIGMVPDAPTGLVAQRVAPVRGKITVALTWQAAAANGGGPVADYFVDYRVAGTSTWIRVRTTISTPGTAIVGLAAGRTYEFRVAAGNAAGIGAYAKTGLFVA